MLNLHFALEHKDGSRETVTRTVDADEVTKRLKKLATLTVMEEYPPSTIIKLVEVQNET
jgi:hypothetical protein